MPIRITFVLDNQLSEKLRNIQAKKIRESKDSVSFSEIINAILKIGLENYKR